MNDVMKLLARMRSAFRAWWKKHICDDAPEGYDIDADVMSSGDCRCASCMIDGPPTPARVDNNGHFGAHAPDSVLYGHAHVEQVPEGKLGDYLAQLDQKPDDTPPMRNANRRFAFCFLATPRSGDKFIADDMSRVSYPMERIETLFLDTGFEGQLPIGYRFRVAPDVKWYYHLSPAPTQPNGITTEPLYL